MRFWPIVVLILVGVICANSTADVWYVDVDNVAGPWDGTSWTTAFNTIQAGVDAASTDDEVWVAEGIYTGTGSNVVEMAEGVHLYGGFAATETQLVDRNLEQHQTIIDGENTRRGVTGANNATLDGFTITRGYAHNGSAMYNSYSSPMVTNCMFSDNTASGDAGGIYNHHSSPTLTNCIFSYNMAEGGDETYILTLDVSDPAEGTTRPTPSTYEYAKDYEVPIHALPNQDWRFYNWQSNYPECIADPNSSTTTVTVNVNLTVTAVFSLSIEDDHLEAALRAAADVPEEQPLTPSDMAEIYILDASNRDIVSLEGIEYCTNLEWLSLDDNLVTDLAPLCGLLNLQELSLVNNGLTDVCSLACLTSLEILNLDDNQITDIGCLAERKMSTILRQLL